MSKTQFTKKLGSKSQCTSTNSTYPVKTKTLLDSSLNVNENSFIEVFKSYKATSKITHQTKVTNDIWSDEDTSKNSDDKPPRKETHFNSKVVCVVDTNEDEALISAESIEKESTEMSTVAAKTEITDLFSGNIARFCPICFKKNTFDQSSGFVSHLKSCALRNNVSTAKLLEAIKLQEKQTTERVALGLPAVAKERQVKRSGVKKKPLDANLELAIALSASLRESEMLDKLKATETLLEAGLEQEAMSQCKQLEDFGFISSRPVAVETAPIKNVSRSKNIRNKILFTRSQEERERIITEKVAIILLDSDNKFSNPIRETSVSSYNLKSVFLRNHRDESSTLWTKSYQLCKYTNDQEFYVKTLSNFISPCKVKMGEKLKHVSQIPCRPLTQEKNIFNADLSELAEVFAPKKKAATSGNLEKKFQKCVTLHDTDATSKLSHDWKILLNKKVMSDVTIYAKNEESIFAHKLVLYVRCHSILSDIIKESAGGKCTEILMWMEYSCEAVMAFLEYIYTGVIPSLKKLSELQIIDLKSLFSRYHFTEMGDFINRAYDKEEMFLSYETDNKEIECTLQVETSETIMPAYSPLNEGEKNLLFLRDALETQKSSDASPEMFSECETFSPEFKVEDCKNTNSFQRSGTFSGSGQFNLLSTSKLPNSSPIPDIDKLHSTGLGTESPDKLSSASSYPSSVIEINTDKFSSKNSFAESFISTLLSPINARENESCENAEKKLDSRISIDVTHGMDISSSFDEDFHQLTDAEVNKLKPNACTNKKFEKRKSYSPLGKSPAKKSKKTTSAVKLLPNKNDNLKLRKRTKRRNRPKLSQSYSISDSCSASDSDASLYKIEQKFDKTAFDSTCELDLPGANKAEKASSHIAYKNDISSLADDTSFETDDFRRVISEEPKTNSYEYGMNNEDNEVENHAISHSPSSDHVTDFKLKIEVVGEGAMNDAGSSPYVSPVWDGFENVNFDHFDMCYSSQWHYTSLASSSPQPKTSSSPRRRCGKNTFDDLNNEKYCTSSFSQPIGRMSVNEPFFDSLSIDESVLNKVESDMRNTEDNVKTPEVKTVTPKDVRKLRCRSKSDTSLTPMAKGVAVTPIADYSNMKSTELKRELDKYGLKPGLSRNKAKQLLRYIYNQLHPFDDEVSLPESNTQGDKKSETAIFIRKSSAKRNLNGKTGPTQTYDSEDSSSTVSTGVAVLEESFVEDNVNARTQDVRDTGSKAVALDIGFRNLIQKDTALHQKILLYEPIWLESVKNALKENGIRCNMNDLMNYLDEKCITFRTQQQRGARRKRRKKKDATEDSSN